MPPLSIEGLICFFGGNALCAIAVAAGTVALAYRWFIAPKLNARPAPVHSVAGAIAGGLGTIRIRHGRRLVETITLFAGTLRSQDTTGGDAAQRFVWWLGRAGVPPPITGRAPMPAMASGPPAAGAVPPRVSLQGTFGNGSPITLILPAERRHGLHESRAACTALLELMWLLHQDWFRSTLETGRLEIPIGDVVANAEGYHLWYPGQAPEARSAVVRYFHTGQPAVIHELRVRRAADGRYEVEYPPPPAPAQPQPQARTWEERL